MAPTIYNYILKSEVLKMEIYTHLNHNVIFQYINDEDGDFLDILSRKGVIPFEIPVDDMSYRVFKYEYNGAVRYAAEKKGRVYITDIIPDDGFSAMMQDINAQIDGHEAQNKCMSRLAIACRIAEDEARRAVYKKYPDALTDFMMYGVNGKFKNEYNIEFAINMAGFGYNKNNIFKVDAPDVDKEELSKILN